MTPPPPPARTPKPAWAVAFKRRREEIVGSQEELAIRADVSQSLVSQIERGVQHPAGVSVERFSRLLNTLNWSAQEFSDATGITINPAAVITVAAPEPEHKAREVEPTQTSRALPDALIEAVQKYGPADPDLQTHEWQQFLARFKPRGPEKDADDWYDFYRNLKKFNVRPGEE